MLIGSGILPPEFFVAARNPFVIGVGACEWFDQYTRLGMALLDVHVLQSCCMALDCTATQIKGGQQAQSRAAWFTLCSHDSGGGAYAPEASLHLYS